jgi:hypothetical protein
VDIVVKDLAFEQRLYLKDDQNYSWQYDDNKITVCFPTQSPQQDNDISLASNSGTKLLQIALFATIRVWIRADMTVSPPAIRLRLCPPV